MSRPNPLVLLHMDLTSKSPPSPLFIPTCLYLLIFLIGCGPTYTEENLTQSILKICKEEYGVDVKVRTVGRTVGVYIPLEGLFDSTVEVTPETTLEEILAGIRFSPEAAKRIDDVCLTVSRVTVSSNAPIDFYTVVASDVEGSGAELILTRYVLDIKRLMMRDISRGDFFHRMIMDVGYNPLIGVEERARGFFRDMERYTAERILSRYFPRLAKVQELSPEFFLTLTELGFKIDRKYHIQQLKSIRLTKDKVLMLCRLRESYRPKAGFENFQFLYPRQFQNEYLILVDGSTFPYTLEQVLPLFSVDASGNVVKRPLPREYLEFEDPLAWEGEFFLEEVKLHQFLARQIANRINSAFKENKKLSQVFLLSSVRGEFLPASQSEKAGFGKGSRQDDKAGIFRFTVDLKEIPSKDTDVFLEGFEGQGSKEQGYGAPPGSVRKGLEGRQQLAEGLKGEGLKAVLTTASHVLRRYDFNDYSEVEVINLADGERFSIPREQLLREYKPRWLRRN